ncbi:gp34.31 [Bacillus phage SPO1]|uniref:Gp34.31 n=3 Tax=Okubovirus TaxID=1857845 RepID=B6V2U4_BPSP1|nr:gp34.31 [Bacillus phage SPO1]ACI91071.1 gp34.31 [Bacillus phage SPO1]APZ82407.1 hypothetical protein Goe2_c17100 [Bacillus phage vB_BsuM-Goe2]
MVYTLESKHEGYSTWWELEDVGCSLWEISLKAIEKNLLQFRIRTWVEGIVVHERKYEGESSR